MSESVKVPPKFNPGGPTVEHVNNAFTYHPPFGDQPMRYEEIRNRAKEYALYLLRTTPPSREQSLAITHLEECVFYANAAIARNEKQA